MLTQRQLLILYKIIEHFTEHGEPVSSKTLVEEGSVDASSATIRNEMSVLEEMNYIEKVHSSSGRIPSVQGYRFYVDNLLRPKNVRQNERIKIKDIMDSHIFQMSDVFYQSAELLSELTNYTAIVLGPQSKLNTLTGFRIVPLNDKQMMLVLQLDNYEVQSMLFKIPAGLKTKHIKQVTEFMNNNLVGESLATVYYALQNDLPKMFEKYLAMNWNVVDMLEHTLLRTRDEQMFVSGKMNLLDFTENMEIRQVKDLYNLLDNEGNLFSLFNSLNNGRGKIDIRIGNELENQLFEPFSLITVPYLDDHFGGGFIAVLGPTNMTYDSTLGVIQLLRSELLDKLEDFYLD
jgi:heat-inducible transcriptional repressor